MAIQAWGLELQIAAETKAICSGGDRYDMLGSRSISLLLITDKRFVCHRTKFTRSLSSLSSKNCERKQQVPERRNVCQ